MACVLLFRQEYEGRAKGEAMRWLVGWGRLFWPQDADYGGGFGLPSETRVRAMSPKKPLFQVLEDSQHMTVSLTN